MDFINNWIFNLGFEGKTGQYLAAAVTILLIALICIVANFLTKKVVVRIISHMVSMSKFKWNDILLKRRVFHKLSHIVPAIIIYYFAPTFPRYQHLIESGANIYLIIVNLIVISSALDAFHDIYETFEISKIRPIKGVIQIVKIVLAIIGIILIISILLNKSPFILLSGLGALSAVLMLVFKDSILGLVAGVQLSANDMVRVGDWITMPKHGADGDVIEISLHTVKVQNFDKTITTIPSYSLISDSFINWRGMQNSGGRRIKRPIYIDVNSIRFCDDEMINKFRRINFLADYIDERLVEIQKFNETHNIDRSNPVNGRALTNIGVFRAYIKNYLLNHSGIHKGMTLMVRQLEPTERGLPIELYCFTNTTDWTEYETIQDDIFDHLFVVAPEFGLRIFQNPSGHDFRNLNGEEKEMSAVGNE
ncbi:mechanosensitive ion channel family protein [Pallidibacillus pasinlerensis]|uniref:Mechanosensitive ion channel n=1 Tax=Pallidibacillus pasinlerensis TaxID=2703818 RepID=A0ABX0A1L2_9BACI|nr:mechanosensitive ion channel domain-containing protein [Pallidibacillus pasinlerensis]NCU17308.1 mechanosensitive ion channel [Pallidibacillus pasinlerensis]